MWGPQSILLGQNLSTQQYQGVLSLRHHPTEVQVHQLHSYLLGDTLLYVVLEFGRIYSVAAVTLLLRGAVSWQLWCGVLATGSVVREAASLRLAVVSDSH